MSVETTTRQQVLATNESFVEYSSPNFSLVLSPSGQELLKRAPHVMGQLRSYRKDFELRRDQQGITRELVQHGNEGVIYTIKQTDIPIAIKEYHLPFPTIYPSFQIENQTDFLKNTLARAEQLQKFCRDSDSVPDYVNVPDHYGLLFLPLQGEPNARECLLFMQRVNGIPLDKFIATSDSPLTKQVEQDWEAEVKSVFEWDLPRTSPEFPRHPLIPDPRRQNILVDTSSPTMKRDYTLWIIDQ